MGFKNSPGNKYHTASCLWKKLHFSCVCVSAEVPTASRPEEEEGGEVRDGRDDRDAADLHRLVPAALYVPCKIRSWSRQPAAGRLVQNHPGWLSGVDAVSFIRSFIAKASSPKGALLRNRHGQQNQGDDPAKAKAF